MVQPAQVSKRWRRSRRTERGKGAKIMGAKEAPGRAMGSGSIKYGGVIGIYMGFIWDLYDLYGIYMGFIWDLYGI